MKGYVIHPIVVGTKIFDKGMMTYQHDYGRQYTIPIYSWLLQGGDKNVLIDTGLMGVIQSEDRQRAIGGPIYTFEEGLSRFGLTPADIDVILHTHLHNDHCENDFKCERATIYAHSLEFESCYDPHPLDFRYMEDFVREVDEAGRMVKIEAERYEPLPGIVMVHTPAHTRGGMSILVDTSQGVVGISGFCTILENFFPPAPVRAMELEVIPPGTNIDPYLAYDQIVRFKEMADIVIPLHEPMFASMERLPDDLPPDYIGRLKG